MATYEQLMNAARKAEEQGNRTDAQRLLQMAVDAKRQAQEGRIKAMMELERRGKLPDRYAPILEEARTSSPSSGLSEVFEFQTPGGAVFEIEAPDRDAAVSAFQTFSNGMKGASKSADGTYGQVPEGMVYNPNTGGYIDVSLPHNRMHPGAAGAVMQGAGQGVSFGGMDEAVGGINALFGPNSMSEDYAYGRDRMRAELEAARQERPATSFAAELSGSMLAPMGPMNALRGTSTGAKMANSAIGAGAYGAAYGFSSGEGGFGDRAENALETGAISAGVGAAAPLVAKPVQKMVQNSKQRRAVNQMVKSAPSVDDLKAQAADLYNRGVRRGRIASADDAATLAADTRQAMIKEGVMRADGSLITRNSDAVRILDDLDDLAKYGLEGNQVKPVREVFKAASKDSNPAHARIGKIAQSKYDDFVGSRAPEFRQGDELYQRAKKTEEIDQLIRGADVEDSANALRNKFKTVGRKDVRNLLPNWTPDEIAAAQKVVSPGAGEQALRWLGSGAPTSLQSATLGAGLPSALGYMAGGPAGAAAAGTAALAGGALARGRANALQRGNADVAKALVASGGQMPKAQISALTKLMIERLIARAGGRSSAVSAQ